MLPHRAHGRVYVDDLIIFKGEPELHQQLLKSVLLSLDEASLKINAKNSKSQMVSCSELIFLGQKLCGKTKDTNDDSVDRVREDSPPGERATAAHVPRSA